MPSRVEVRRPFYPGCWQYVTIRGRRTAVMVLCGPAAPLPERCAR